MESTLYNKTNNNCIQQYVTWYCRLHFQYYNSERNASFGTCERVHQTLCVREGGYNHIKAFHNLFLTNIQPLNVAKDQWYKQYLLEKNFSNKMWKAFVSIHNAIIMLLRNFFAFLGFILFEMKSKLNLFFS